MEEGKHRPRLFGQYMEELGICTAEQVSSALEYCAACSKRNTFLSIGQALVELGYTTQDKIEEVLRIQAKDRAAVVREAAPQAKPIEPADDAVPEAELEEQVEATGQVEEPDIYTPQQAGQLGIFTADQVREAVDYCIACGQRKCYLSLGQAMVKLGHATRDDIDEALATEPEKHGSTEGRGAAPRAAILLDAGQLAQAREAAEILGLCTPEQLDDAVGYCSDCAKRHRQVSLGQALIELGHTTQQAIDEVLRSSSRERAKPARQEQPGASASDRRRTRRDRFRRPHRLL